MADKLIFVSCGQWSAEEKQLGKSVVLQINAQPGLVAYFAENQSTLEGLTTAILAKLDACSAFIGIMHERGTVSVPQGNIVRGSVWIEQEIAIAAYIKQILKRKIEVKLFLRKGIVLEGIREKLGISPFHFESDDQILVELSSVLSEWRDVLKPREPETLPERIEQFARERTTLTVRGERPVDARVAAVFGNRRWNGEDECQIERFNESHVTFLKLGVGANQTVPYKYLTLSYDDKRHRPLLLVSAEGS